MQIDRLTLLQGEAAASEPSGLSAAFQAGQANFDFGAFLLSMLTSDSLPFEAESPTGEMTGETTEGPIIEGTAKPLPPLLGADRQPEGTTPFPGLQLDQKNNNTVTENITTNDILNANMKPIVSMGFNKNAGISSNLVADDAAVTTSLYPTVEQAEPQDPPLEYTLRDGELPSDRFSLISPTVFSGTAADAAAQTLSLSPVTEENVEWSNAPVKSGGQDMSFVQHRPHGQPSAVLTAAGRAVNNHPLTTPGLTVEAKPQPVVQPETADRKSIPEVLTQSKHGSYTPAPVSRDIVRLPGVNTGLQANDIETSFPGVKIEALSVSPEEAGTPKTSQPFAATNKSGSDAVSSPEKPVPAVGEKTPSVKEQTINRLAKKDAGKPTPAIAKQEAAPPPEPKRTEGMAIRTAAQSLSPETDTKPAIMPNRLDSPVVSVGKSESAVPEDTQQVRFTIEPESLRSPVRPPAEIRLRLHPQELGVVKLNLRMIDNHLTARAVVQSSAARLAIEGNLAHLQRTLADAGLMIERFEVMVGHTPSTAPTHPDAEGQRRRYSFKPKTNRRYQAVAGLPKTAVSPAPTAGWTTTEASRYRLNMVA